MEVNLPGGLYAAGEIHRNARFNQLTGLIEQQLLDVGDELSRPEYVTKVLSVVLERIGDFSADEDLLANTSVADRQYLMLRAAALLQGEQMWLKATCNNCAQDFDVDVRRDQLPVKLANQEFPFFTININNDELKLRMPTGRDQSYISDVPEQEAVKKLLQECLVSVNGQPAPENLTHDLSAEDIDLIDETLDELAPSVCDRLQVVCPECGNQQINHIDHCALAPVNQSYFYDEVHSLALNYHWSEAEILALTRNKRRIYLELINRSGDRG